MRHPSDNTRVRFAPSPTGCLHVGNARIAALNALFTRRTGGWLLLRMDDTDAARGSRALEAAIMDDLAWLGVRHDGFFRQSARGDIYAAAAARLEKAGRLYPCYETPEELSAAQAQARARGRPPVYDRAALRLDPATRARLEAAGRKPHWRFRLLDRETAWDDAARGPTRIGPGHVSDPVVRRADRQWLYTLTSVVDDMAAGITHVIRGADHITNTAAQIQLFAALGWDAPPAFAHLPLLVGMDGKPLSKRDGGGAVADLRAAGLEPRAVRAALARMGMDGAPDADTSEDALAAALDLRALGRATPRHDPAAMAAANARALASMPFQQAEARLRAMGAVHATAPFWRAVRENLNVMADAMHWHTVCFGDPPPKGAPATDTDFLEAARRLLPGDWRAPNVWNRWTKAVAATTGRRGRALFAPLRMALTGRDAGPAMSDLLPLIGRERALERLQKAVDNTPSGNAQKN